MSLSYAYQGEPGAYSEMAALKHFDEEPAWNDVVGHEHPVGIPCTSFADVVEAVVSDEATCGIVPVENSLEGNIDEATDLLVDLDLHVVGEVEQEVAHVLMARKGTSIDDVTHVHSHPQGLRQCRDFLAEHPAWKRVAEYDTAGSARMLAEMDAQLGADPKGHAAIASRLAADQYHLDVLASGIASGPENYTRFLVVSKKELHHAIDLQRQPPNGAGYKTSLVFGTRDQPGALYQALGAFNDRDVNLTKLESRPRRGAGKRWQYHFFVDCEGHAADEALSAVLGTLARQLAFLKVLGSYPKAMAHAGH